MDAFGQREAVIRLFGSRTPRGASRKKPELTNVDVTVSERKLAPLLVGQKALGRNGDAE
jgi:hypothetical protein